MEEYGSCPKWTRSATRILEGKLTLLFDELVGLPAMGLDEVLVLVGSEKLHQLLSRSLSYKYRESNQ
jgi:hypothetical protein